MSRYALGPHCHPGFTEPRHQRDLQSRELWLHQESPTIEPRPSLEIWRIGEPGRKRHAIKQAVRYEIAIHEASKRLFSQETWEDQITGPPKALNAAWTRAATLLRRLGRQLAVISVPTPDIAVADDGSIDLLWRWNDHRVLLHVPADSQTIRLTARRPSGERKSAEIQYDGRTLKNWSDILWGFRT